MNPASVFPPVSPGRAREVDAAGGVCWVCSEDITWARDALNAVRAVNTKGQG